MDPFVRKLTIQQYEDFILVLSEELDKYKRKLEPSMGIPIKFPPDLQKKANTLEALSSALETIKKAIKKEDYEGQNYLYQLPFTSDLNSLHKKNEKFLFNNKDFDYSKFIVIFFQNFT